MRIQRTFLFITILFFIILTGAVANAQTTKWYKYEAGMEEARSTGKPVLLEFYADWCSPCIAMEKGTYPDPGVISEMKDFIAIKVDTQVRIDIEKKYHISYYPTIVFLDPGGAEIARHVGYLDPEGMVKTINESRGKLPKEAPGFDAANVFLIMLFTMRMFFFKKKHSFEFFNVFHHVFNKRWYIYEFFGFYYVLGFCRSRWIFRHCHTASGRLC